MAGESISPVLIAGITFKNPFYVASGPTARSVRQLLAIEKAGWAAASIKLSIDPAPYINREPRYSVLQNYGALGFTAEKRLTADEGLRLVSDAKRALRELILMANITYAGPDGPDGWARLARRFAEAGADIIELNMCCPNMSFNVETTGGEAMNFSTGASLGNDGARVGAVVRAIKAATNTPLFVKLTPEGGNIGRVAKMAWEAGADAVGGTGNRLGMPPINLEDPAAGLCHLQDEPGMICLSGEWLKPLAQRDTYEMRMTCGPEMPIMATGGIRNATDALEMAMCGADLFGICTETLMSGYNFIGTVIEEANQWLAGHGCADWKEIRDRMLSSLKSAPELTLHKGYAAVRKPGLVAPCRAACPALIDIQGVLRHIAGGELNRAAELAGGSDLCEGCHAPCETACVKGRVAQGLSIRAIMLALRAHAAGGGIRIPGRQEAPEQLAVSRAADVLGRRVIHGAERPIKRIDDIPSAHAEAERCLRCGCGEGCGKCADICCEFAVEIKRGRVEINPAECVGCGMCYQRCPNQNIAMAEAT